MDKKKVFIVASSGAYVSMFQKEGWEVIDNIPDADLVQFTGGADVTPALYGEYKHPCTGNDPRRDHAEQASYNLAQELGIACAGICRGGQFLNVMNGGKMWQDVDGHALAKGHVAYMYGYMFPIFVTSTHHQMMRPNYDVECIITMTARQTTYKERMEGEKIERMPTPMFDKDRLGAGVSHLPDIESVYYADSNSLCFQPHPEFIGADQCRRAYFHLLNNYCFEDKQEFQDKVLVAS